MDFVCFESERGDAAEVATYHCIVNATIILKRKGLSKEVYAKAALILETSEDLLKLDLGVEVGA